MCACPVGGAVFHSYYSLLPHCCLIRQAVSLIPQKFTVQTMMLSLNQINIWEVHMRSTLPKKTFGTRDHLFPWLTKHSQVSWITSLCTWVISCNFKFLSVVKISVGA